MGNYPRLTRELLERLSQGELIALILAQEERIEALERRLGLNSYNSSKPPSSDGPKVPPPPPKPGTGRKRGGQPGHEGHVRAFLPCEAVSEVVEHIPEVCCDCGKPLVGVDPNPTRHQIWKLPSLAPVVAEHRFHSLRCECGALPTARSAAMIRGRAFGPNPTALSSLLTGVFHVSRRSALELMNTVFNCPMSLGGLSSCEEEASESLSGPAFGRRCYGVKPALAFNRNAAGSL